MRLFRVAGLHFYDDEQSLKSPTSALFRQGPDTPLTEEDVTGLGALLQEADASIIDRFSPAVLKKALQSALPFRRLRCMHPDLRKKILATLNRSETVRVSVSLLAVRRHFNCSIFYSTV